ncbi:MAG TPA: DNA primase [Steroidobacter sp.]|nr:DNA primase [Steroidobacter sp.]
MSGRIPQHFIDELIARTDLVEVIGSRVPLKKQGKEFKACCPFHGEKTPSFTVAPEKQFYHCFGCGAHGTALGFLMEHDHLSFVEAVEELASRAGLEIPREHQQTARPAPSEGLFRMLEEAAEYYRRGLKNSPRAREYFRGRGVAGETAARFGLGYAPDAWDGVLTELGSTDAERMRLLQVGLIIERERRTGSAGSPGFYDRFRDRVMFPIRDARGRTIAFGGRVLDKGEPKYLNSPETELFHKGRELYGLYEARQASRTLTRIVVVEGYMDVVRLHQAGITYAAATLGTATTPEHLSRIFRICSEVIFCFDGDRAGRAAAWRALENSLNQVREGRQIRFLFLPEGHDPDSLVGAEGAEAFEKRLSGAMPLSEYFLSHLSSQADLQTVDGRARLGELARPLIERIPPGIYRELLADELAKLVGLEPSRMGIAVNAPEPPPAAARSAVPAGKSGLRRNLLRQCIHLLVHYPEIAHTVTESGALALVERPGIPLLLELLQELQARPCATTGALLERWRGRPEVEHLAKLAAMECLIPDAAGAARELSDAVHQLAREGAGRRREQLLSKHGREGLTDEEKAELQTLLTTHAGERAEADDRT